MITAAAMKSGFGVGLMVDNPNSSKNRHTFLILTVSHDGDLAVVPTKQQQAVDLIEAENGEAGQKQQGKGAVTAPFLDTGLDKRSKKINKFRFKKGKFRPAKKSRAWVL